MKLINLTAMNCVVFYGRSFKSAPKNFFPIVPVPRDFMSIIMNKTIDGQKKEKHIILNCFFYNIIV